jgi:hypothetical protein
VLGNVAHADCEAIHAGLVRQPVAALTSLAFLAVGVWILARLARRRVAGARAEPTAFGIGLIGVGIGSVLLHGPNPSWALWFHDLSGLSVLLLVAVLDLGWLLRWPFGRRLLVVGAGMVLLGSALAVAPTATVPIAFVLAPLAGLSEAAALRSGRHPRPTRSWSPTTTAWVVAVVTLGLAGVTYLLGRSGSPACHPGSVIQWHAAWHVLVALSAGAYAFAVFEPDRGSSGSHPVTARATVADDRWETV